MVEFLLKTRCRFLYIYKLYFQVLQQPRLKISLKEFKEERPKFTVCVCLGYKKYLGLLCLRLEAFC